MTISSIYRIGTTYGGMVDVVSFAANMRDKEPRGLPIDYSQNIDLGDGTRKGMGWQTQDWHWDFMSETMRNSLHAFIGPVYIQTRMNDGAFGYFTAVMVWPDAESEHYSDRVLDLTITFRKMISYSPPA